jgi:peptide/nickel transport system permease protein
VFKFITSKLTYGFLVLFGVVTVVFFLFNLSPADPVRNLLGENAPESLVQATRKKLDLDLPLGTRYALYINDLSPLSIYSPNNTGSRIAFSSEKYSGLKLISFTPDRALYLKLPYLKRSFLTERNVSNILGEVMPGTIVLAVLSIALALLLGLIMGVVAALHQNTVYDRLLLFISALGMAGPSFFVAILVAWLGAIVWREQILVSYTLLVGTLLAILLALWLKNKIHPLLTASFVVTCSFVLWWVAPNKSWLSATLVLPGTGLNMTGSLYSVDVWKGEYIDLKNMILPIITLMVRPLSVIVQLTRSSLLEVMSQDYIRTARAKGLSETRVIVKHALRNALNPVITAVSGWFASLLAGAVFVEFVFGWKGLGQEMFTAIEKQDLPVVMGGVLVIASAFVLINLIVDLIYGFIDPRVRMN